MSPPSPIYARSQLNSKKVLRYIFGFHGRIPYSLTPQQPLSFRKPVGALLQSIRHYLFAQLRAQHLPTVHLYSTEMFKVWNKLARFANPLGRACREQYHLLVHNREYCRVQVRYRFLHIISHCEEKWCHHLHCPYLEQFLASLVEHKTLLSTRTACITHVAEGRNKNMDSQYLTSFFRSDDWPWTGIIWLSGLPRDGITAPVVHYNKVQFPQHKTCSGCEYLTVTRVACWTSPFLQNIEFDIYPWIACSSALILSGLISSLDKLLWTKTQALCDRRPGTAIQNPCWLITIIQVFLCGSFINANNSPVGSNIYNIIFKRMSLKHALCSLHPSSWVPWTESPWVDVFNNTLGTNIPANSSSSHILKSLAPSHRTKTCGSISKLALAKSDHKTRKSSAYHMANTAEKYCSLQCHDHVNCFSRSLCRSCTSSGSNWENPCNLHAGTRTWQ